MKDGKILVVGGYGGVGRIISTTLGDLFPGQVIAAGRNYARAKELSLETEERVIPMRIDVAAQESDEPLKGVSLVVMCIDQTDTGFVERCIRQGIDYVDITATYDFLHKVESLDAEAQSHNATTVLSVGLAPGLTNLLASHCKSVLDNIQRVDIYIMLGLGDSHGEAAIRWTLENLNVEFPVTESGSLKRVKAFEEGKRADFPDPPGRRTAYRFNFSDQRVIPRTLSIDSASTWLCFDSALATRAFALSAKMGLFGTLRYKWVEDVFVKALQILNFGSDEFLITAEARGDGHETYKCSISGREEGRMTALVAAKVAESLCTSSFPSGVFHIEQLFEPLPFIEGLKGHGLEFLNVKVA